MGPSSDAIAFYNYFHVDPSANGFSVDFVYPFDNFWSPASFNGFKLSSLNFDDLSFLTGFDFDTNMSGLTASHFSFTEDSFSVNWQNLPFNQDTYLNVSFKTGGGTVEPESVPEPTSTITFGILGGGLLLSRKMLQKAA